MNMERPQMPGSGAPEIHFGLSKAEKEAYAKEYGVFAGGIDRIEKDPLTGEILYKGGPIAEKVKEENELYSTNDNSDMYKH